MNQWVYLNLGGVVLLVQVAGGPAGVGVGDAQTEQQKSAPNRATPCPPAWT
jgi:hypothetical protein